MFAGVSKITNFIPFCDTLLLWLQQYQNRCAKRRLKTCIITLPTQDNGCPIICTYKVYNSQIPLTVSFITVSPKPMNGLYETWFTASSQTVDAQKETILTNSMGGFVILTPKIRFYQVLHQFIQNLRTYYNEYTINIIFQEDSAGSRS